MSSVTPMVLDLTLLALLPLDVQLGVRAAAAMESRDAGRLISPDEMVLLMVTTCLRLHGGTRPTLKASQDVPSMPGQSIRADVVAVLGDQALPVAVIARHIHVRRGAEVAYDSLSSALTELVQRGILRRPSRGVYQKVPHSTAWPTRDVA